MACADQRDARLPPHGPRHDLRRRSGTSQRAAAGGRWFSWSRLPRRRLRAALAVLSRRHDVVPVVVSDPAEEALPEIPGLWPVVDAETGEAVLVDLSDARTRRGTSGAPRSGWRSASGSSAISRSRRSGSVRATTTSLRSRRSFARGPGGAPHDRRRGAALGGGSAAPRSRAVLPRPGGDPEQVALGDLVEVRLAVEHDARDVYRCRLRSVADGGAAGSGRAALAPYRPGRRKSPTEFELTLADYATLEPRVPDLTLAVSGPDGARQLSIRGRPLKFPQPGRGGGTAVAGARAPWAESRRSRSRSGATAGRGSWGAGARHRVPRRARAAREATPAAETPALEAFADDLALQRLAALRTDAAWVAAGKGAGRSSRFRRSSRLSGCAAPVQRARSDQR